MPKKRTSLDSLFESSNKIQPFDIGKETKSTVNTAVNTENNNQPKPPNVNLPTEVSNKAKNEIVKQTVYLPSAVHEQLRHLAFEERKKMHDYLVEGLDRVFKDRGLKSYAELSGERN